MPRPIILFSGTWSDLPLEELAQRTSEWGYQGVELCCCRDHLEVQRALAEPDYCRPRLELLARHELSLNCLSIPRAGHAVCEVLDRRHKRLRLRYSLGT